MASNHTPGLWQADDCPDVRGFTTIRAALAGSPHGDTESQPIATVYDDRAAPIIAEAPAMLEALRAFVHQRDFFAEHGEYDLHTYHPDENQQFDDWAADIAATILARIDGAAPSGEAVAPTAQPAAPIDGEA